MKLYYLQWPMSQVLGCDTSSVNGLQVYEIPSFIWSFKFTYFWIVVFVCRTRCLQFVNEILCNSRAVWLLQFFTHSKVSLRDDWVNDRRQLDCTVNKDVKGSCLGPTCMKLCSETNCVGFVHWVLWFVLSFVHRVKRCQMCVVCHRRPAVAHDNVKSSRWS